jgi:hypothetical protein
VVFVGVACQTLAYATLTCLDFRTYRVSSPPS